MLHAEHVGQDVVGDTALPLRAHPPRQRDRTVLDVHDDVVDVEAIVRGEALAHEVANLAIVELVQVLKIFVVARHRSPPAEGVRRLRPTGEGGGRLADCGHRDFPNGEPIHSVGLR